MFDRSNPGPVIDNLSIRTIINVIMHGTIREVSRRPRSPLTLIPVMTVLLLGMLWIAVLARLHVDKNTALREARLSADILAQSLASHTLKAIHDMDEIALFSKYAYESAPGQFSLKAWQANGLIAGDTALQVTLVGANGHILTSTGALSGDVDLSDREHIAVHRRRSDVGLFISRPVIGRVSGRWSVQGTRRIDRPDGSFGGVVVISEDPAWLTESFYNTAALGDHGLVAVLAPDGALLSRRTGDARGPLDSPLQLPYLHHQPHAGEGTVVDPLDHVERIVAVRRLEPYGLVVVAGLSLAEALDDYARMRQVYLAMTLLISTMLVGFAAWIMVLFSRLNRGREALRRLSETDSLTGLPNRSRMTQLLESAVAGPRAAGTTALIFVDLDEFKQLNDTYGHHAGDRLLVEVAGRLRKASGKHAIAGRLGGDEFVILVQAPDAHGLAQRIADNVTVALADCVSINGTRYRVRASLGIGVHTPDETACELLAKADGAMYNAKQRRHTHAAASEPVSRETAFPESRKNGHARRRFRDAPSAT